jgi:hypothetical protein
MPPTPDEERVRRLLADARHDEPVPEDVAARLDGVLADLARQRGTDGTDVVTARRLGGGHRTRRRWLTGLTAAAALVVVGVVGRELWPAATPGKSDSSVAGQSSSGHKAAGEDAGGAARPSASAPNGAAAALVAPAYAALGVQPLAPGLTVVCDTSPAGKNTAVVVEEQGRPALMVIRPVRSPGRPPWSVDLLRCDTGARIRSAPLPGR